MLSSQEVKRKTQHLRKKSYSSSKYYDDLGSALKRHQMVVVVDAFILRAVWRLSG